MTSPEIIYTNTKNIIDIVVAKVELYGSPFRCSIHKHSYPFNKKVRGKKYGYMIYVKFKGDNFEGINNPFGYRVYTKKAAMRMVYQIEAAVHTIYRRYLREAYGHHLHTLLTSVHSYLYNHNVHGDKHFRTHLNAQGNKDFFPTFYMLCNEYKKMNLFQPCQG
jgi:hypothetical protein